ncbi:MAG TPA: pilus assembly protein TadG-related protein [Azospirillum sp.]|nr:pilus assembly protein TadG-related protein [Azospirillum sp.]
MLRRTIQIFIAVTARLRRDEDGAMVVTIALLMTLLMGLLGVGVEVGSWYMTRRSLQTAADAAAIAGALEEARGSAGRVTSAATLEAKRNGAQPASDVIRINAPPTSGAFKDDPQAVEAIITRPRERLFSAVLSADAVSISARAVARVRATGEACVLALDPASSGAITAQGSTTLKMQGCLLAANSTSNAAVDMGGSATVAADGLWTAGDVSTGGSSNLSFVKPPTTHAWPLPDPYAALPIPSPGPCKENNIKIDKPLAQPLDPGTYCGDFSVGSQGVVVLNPGTYYIDRGSIDINAQAQIRCNCSAPGSGVTFVLTSSGNTSQIGTVSINGSATIDLRAPSEPGAPFRGVLFYQDRRAPAGKANTFNGGSTIALNGAFYFPAQRVNWNGNTAASAGAACLQIIARTASFSGNSTLDNSGCAAMGAKPVTTTAAALGE